MAAVREGGYDGVQFHISPEPEVLDEALKQGLGVCGAARVNVPEDAVRVAQEAHLMGLECLTLHVGWGLEDDDQAVAKGGQGRMPVAYQDDDGCAACRSDMWIPRREKRKAKKR